MVLVDIERTANATCCSRRSGTHMLVEVSDLR